MKFSERLDENPRIGYYDKNGELCGLIHMHLVMIKCSSVMFEPLTHDHWQAKVAKHSKTLVVGTHRDLQSTWSETWVEKNR